MIDLELVFSAVGIDDDLIHRWIDLNAPVLELCYACVVTDSCTHFDGIRTVRINPTSQFAIGKTLNRGIWSSESRVIVRTDVDIVHSLAAIQDIWTYVTVGTAMISKCANVDIDDLPHAKWSNLPIRKAGRGASFAMHIHDWHRLRGYDEYMIGWGGDDDDLYRRAKEMITVYQHQKYPVYHINHDSRKTSFFPDRGQDNLQGVDERGKWHDNPRSQFWGQPWEDQDWGEAKLIGEEKTGDQND